MNMVRRKGQSIHTRPAEITIQTSLVYGNKTIVNENSIHTNLVEIGNRSRVEVEHGASTSFLWYHVKFSKIIMSSCGSIEWYVTV